MSACEDALRVLSVYLSVCLSVRTLWEFCVCLWELFERARKESSVSIFENTFTEPRQCIHWLFVTTLWESSERGLSVCLSEHFQRAQKDCCLYIQGNTILTGHSKRVVWLSVRTLSEGKRELSICLSVCENACFESPVSVRTLWECYICLWEHFESLWGCFESSVCLSVCLSERLESSVSVCENALGIICLSVRMLWEFYGCLSVRTLWEFVVSVITPSEFCVCLCERFERAQKDSSVSVCDNTIIEPRSLFSVCSWERFERALKVGCLRLSFRVRQRVVRLSVVVPNVIMTNVRSPKI